MEKSNLTNANLSRAYMAGVNLSNASLKGARFYGAKLIGANLSGANFEEAIFTGVDFRGANMKMIKNLTYNQLLDAYSLVDCENLDPTIAEILKKKKPCLFRGGGCFE